ncbi:hypothetical protein R1sor_026323 [Riccia sorocarpa]|uniref:GH18 domain-containing protein n=1 Tax=Riccia sorocarpa TaxID=122646 RepID=A0ABD3GEC6_9MARC
MAWKMLLAVLGLVLIQAAAVPSPSTYSQKITTPTWFVDPCDLKNTTCDWRGYANGANTVILDLIQFAPWPETEISWGPGPEVDPSYAKLIKQIRETKQSGTGAITTILGTVKVGYRWANDCANLTAVNETRIKSEIDRWNSFYNVDGFFFDSVSLMNCVSSNLLASLVKYVHDHTTIICVTIADWTAEGSADESYLQTTPSVDSFLTFMGNHADYEEYVLRPYMTRWYHIVGDVPQSKLASTVQKSIANRAGRVFFTDKRLDLTLGQLPGGKTDY